MKIEKLTRSQIQQHQEKQRISIDELSELSEFSELSDEEMLQIAGGGWVDVLESIIKDHAPLIIPLFTG